jgi:pimeloyl-ACP methyl ester carboxylesterase
MEMVRTLAQAVASPADRARLYELAQRDRITEAEAADLARILAPVYATRSDDLMGEVRPPTPGELLKAWKAMASDLPRSTPTLRDGDFGFAHDKPAAPAQASASAGPQAASFSWSDLDPRWIYRVATVYQMKDRAGVVGSFGVKPMLDAIQAANTAEDAAQRTRVHLLGHSYGGKVMLSALCYDNQAGAPKVDSLLLLEPAVSYLCFAADVDGQGTPGGYAVAPGRVRQPILSTYSSADEPLTRYFHLALRRASDLGDQKIAGVPPSRYAALGGFGPASGPGVDAVDIITDIPNTRYALAPGDVTIIGVNGSPDAAGQGIHGHGDVSNPFTYWMLYNQITEAATG